MNLFAMMETSGSAMQAERMRAEVVAANMANAETTRTANGTAYHRQHVVFAANAGDPEFANSFNAASGTTASGSNLSGSLAAAALPALSGAFASSESEWLGANSAGRAYCCCGRGYLAPAQAL